MTEDDHESPHEDIGYRRPPPAVMPRPQRRTTTMARQQTDPPAEEDAPARGLGFIQLLQQLDDGEFLLGLDEECSALAPKLVAFSEKYQRAGKGQLTITIDLAAIGKTMQVTAAHKTKEPRAKGAGTTLFVGKDGRLTIENPKQQKLPLREVPPSTTRTKELPADQPTRAL